MNHTAPAPRPAFDLRQSFFRRPLTFHTARHLSRSLTVFVLKSALNAGMKTRSQVLREAAESTEMTNKAFTEAWVVMQYFGYLRRDGAASEYAAWKTYLDQNPTKWRQMINGFMNSTEYRQRFGQP